MVPEINYWAVLVATLASMVIGSVWYTPKVFGKRWMELAKVPQPETSAAAWRPIIVAIVTSFVLAWVLAGATMIASEFYEGSFLVSALLTAVILWAGFTAARFITHDSFEGRPFTLTVMNIAMELVTVLAMAVIIGLWPPVLG